MLQGDGPFVAFIGIKRRRKEMVFAVPLLFRIGNFFEI